MFLKKCKISLHLKQKITKKNRIMKLKTFEFELYNFKNKYNIIFPFKDKTLYLTL